MSEREQAAEAIAQMANDNGGKIFMGMVHHMYGPLRGLNFILDTPNVEEVLSSMDSQETPMEAEDQIKLIDDIKTRNPNNVQELCVKIWTETALSPRLMVLPFDMSEQAENPPAVVSSIDEGIKEVVNVLKMTSGLQGQDAFFYRTGII